MKAVPIIALLAGLALTATLVAVFGASAVVHSFLAIGWRGFIVICLIHLGLIAVMGIAWRGLVPGAPVWAFPSARLVREAGSEVLPLSPIGGCVLGARALILAGISGSTAAASTIVDLTLEFFAKIVYTALGLILLVGLRPGSAIAAPLTAGVAVASLAAVGFVAAQRRGFTLVDRLARTLGRGWAERTAAGTAALRGALRRMLRAKSRIVGRLFPPLVLLDRRHDRSLVCPSPSRKRSAVQDRAGDRKPALRGSHLRRRHPECGRHTGGSLCADRRRVWVDAADRAGAVIGEAGARFGDWIAGPRRLANRRRRAALAPRQDAAACRPGRPTPRQPGQE